LFCMQEIGCSNPPVVIEKIFFKSNFFYENCPPVLLAMLNTLIQLNKHHNQNVLKQPLMKAKCVYVGEPKIQV